MVQNHSLLNMKERYMQYQLKVKRGLLFIKLDIIDHGLLTLFDT